MLIEKPCAVSSSDLDDMLDACSEAGVAFMDGVMFMHHNRYVSRLAVSCLQA